MRKFPTRKNRKLAHRAGAAALDYALVLGIILPLIAMILRWGPKIIGLVYEMVSLLVSWPFM
jgi:hypothetical protein